MEAKKKSADEILPKSGRSFAVIKIVTGITDLFSGRKFNLDKHSLAIIFLPSKTFVKRAGMLVKRNFCPKFERYAYGNKISV